MNNDLPAIVENAPLSSDQTAVKNIKIQKISSLVEALPESVKVYVSYKGNDQFLVRFHNMGQETNLTLKYKYEELTMTANQNKCDMINSKLRWNNQTIPECV